MELHPAVAFGAALGGAAVLGAVGAVLALPAAAMAPALVADWGERHPVVRNDLVEVRTPAGVEAVGEDPTSPQVTARLRAGRRGLAQRHASRASTTAPSSRWPPTGRWRGPRAIRTWPIFPRSALKPLQAAAMVGAGLRARGPAARRRLRQPRRPAGARRGGARRSSPPPGSTRPTSTTRRRMPIEVEAMREVVRARRRPGFDHPELQRQACGDAGDRGDQRLADRRLPRPGPPGAARDPRRPRGPRRRGDRHRRRRVRGAGAGRVVARPGPAPSRRSRRRRPRRCTGRCRRIPRWSAARPATSPG